jgi:hypothetical protein
MDDARAGIRHLLRLAALVAILLLAFALRAHQLGAQSFWNDEGSSYVQATRAFADIVYHAGRDIHPPGYYGLLALWRGLAGESETGLRLLSVFASVLTVAFSAGLARRLSGGVAAWVTALFVALNSFSIYYAQEARMYALLALWAVVALWLLAGLLAGGRARGWRAVIALGVVNAAGLYTQYAYFYILLTQAAVVALWAAGTSVSAWRRGARPLRTLGMIVLAQGLALLLFLPWLPTALTQVTTWPNTGEPTPIPEALGGILQWLVYGVTARDEVLAVPWLLLIFGLFTLNLRGREGRRILWKALLPAAWVSVSVGVFLAQGLYRESNLKFLLPAQVGMALWLAGGVAVLWEARPLRRPQSPARDARLLVMRAAGAAAALFTAGVMWGGLAPLTEDPAFQRADYRTMARLAAEELGAGDFVILNAPNQLEVFRYYYQGDARVLGLPAGLGGDDGATEDALLAALDDAARTENAMPRIMALFWGERERDPNRVVERALDALAYSVGDTWFGDVRLARYSLATARTDWQPGAADAVYGAEGVRLVSSRVSVGGDILIELRWQANTPLTERYKVFVQLLDGEGALIAQHDSEPGGDSMLTTAWQPGEVVVDRHALRLPADALPGDYTLIAGLYRTTPPYSRLALVDGEDFVTIASVTLR